MPAKSFSDDQFRVHIGQEPLACRNGEDFAILEPLGGILLDGSVEGYTPQQLDQMATTLAKYDRPVELEKLRQLMAARRK